VTANPPPTKFELVLNLKATEALGPTVRKHCSPPPDEMIE
jgi:hypothetical protein